MRKSRFKDIKELAGEMIRQANENKDVLTVMLYDEANLFIKELLKNDRVNAGLIEIEEPGMGYAKEYYITVMPYYYDSVNELLLYAEKAYKDGLGKNKDKEGYLFTESDVAYIHGDVNSRILGQIDARRVYEVEFDGDEPEPLNGVETDETISASKGEDVTITTKEGELEIPFDVDISVDVTTGSDEDKKHLEGIEKMILDVISEALDMFFDELL